MKRKTFISLFILLLGNPSISILANQTSEGMNDVTSMTANHVAAYTTTADQSKMMAESDVQYSEGVSSLPTIKLDDATKYQTMDGFGAAITGATCYNLLKMSAANRHKFLLSTFSETEGLGYSYVRICIGCSDFSLSNYTCCDTKGIENFSLTNEELNYVIPILKEILAINPNLKIIGSPWTCPRWMKVSDLTSKKGYNSWTGGHLNPNYYQDYATYFVKWIKSMESYGIKIYAITPQNEPLNQGNSASLYMPWQEELAFVRDALGPKFKETGTNTQIYAFDHNFNYDNVSGQEHYPLHLYADNAATDFLTGAAYHNYGGSMSEMSYIEKNAPTKGLIFTETSIGMWNDGRNFNVRFMSDMKNIGLISIANYCKAVIVWNLMLDTDMGPYRSGGCSQCYGAVDISKSDYATISPNSHYYVIGHLSKVVKQGAYRIGTSGYTSSTLTYQAFLNPDGSHALVALNSDSSDLRLNITDGIHNFTFTIPANAATSFRW
jgi:glucosylceramidase